MAHQTLAKIRKKLGFSSAEVAQAGRWSRKDFGEIERSGELDVDDALRLNDLYGVDVGAVLQRGRLKATDLPVAALLKGNAEILTADTRFAMTEALSVARDIREVEEALGVAPELKVSAFAEDDDLSHPREGHVKVLAARARDCLGLVGPIPSLLEVTERLGILIFTCAFNDRLLDAFSTWSPHTGPVIVVNADSPRVAGPLGLRAALAHEIEHLLFDRKKMRSLDSFCAVERPTKGQLRAMGDHEHIEQRARAFQVEFLAPQKALRREQHRLVHLPPHEQLRTLSKRWGVGPVAVAWQIANAEGPDFTASAEVQVDGSGFGEWQGLRVPKRPAKVPSLRRGSLLALVRHAVTTDQMSVSWARELLRLGVADFDGLYGEWMS